MIDSTSEPQTRDLHGDDSSLRFHQAIERLYEVFADYPPNLEGCPCCTTQEMREPLESKPLRELTGDDLFAFHMIATTTWSDGDGLRHYLPRILDLIATQASSSLDFYMVARKLVISAWQKWPETEQRAIEDYVGVLWRRLIQGYPARAPGIEDALIGTSMVAEDIRPYLREWSEEQSGSGALHLAEFVLRNGDALLEERPCYQRPRFASQAWGWSDNELRAIDSIIQWLLEPERLICLRDLRDHPSQIPLDFDLEKAIQTLEILQGKRERGTLDQRLNRSISGRRVYPASFAFTS